MEAFSLGARGTLFKALFRTGFTEPLKRDSELHLSHQIQRALVRNNQTQRFSQKQAQRLHQGLVTSTTEQVASLPAVLVSLIERDRFCARL